MANLFATNVTGSAASAMFRLKELLKSAGWTVTQSSDGTTYSSTGDVISHGGSGAGGLGNSSAWVVVRQPLARGARREFCFRHPGSTFSFAVTYSKGAGFTGGSPGPTTQPTASDGQQRLVYWDASIGTAQMMAQGSGAYGFWLATYSGGSTRTALMFDPLMEGTYPAEDPDPYVIYATVSPILANRAFVARQASSNSNEDFLTNSNGIHLYAWVTGSSYARVAVSTFLYWRGTARNYIVAEGGPNPASGQSTLLPAVYGTSEASADAAPNGVKGISTFMRFNTSFPLIGATTTDKSRIQIGHVALPWDGETVPAGDGGTFSAYDTFAEPAPAVLTPLSPPVGDAIDSDAALSVRVLSTSPVIVYASLAGHRATEVVFVNGALLPPYTAMSEVVAVEGGWDLTLRRSGGWPGAVTLHAHALEGVDA